MKVRPSFLLLATCCAIGVSSQAFSDRVKFLRSYENALKKAFKENFYETAFEEAIDTFYNPNENNFYNSEKEACGGRIGSNCYEKLCNQINGRKRVYDRATEERDTNRRVSAKIRAYFASLIGQGKEARERIRKRIRKRAVKAVPEENGQYLEECNLKNAVSVQKSISTLQPIMKQEEKKFKQAQQSYEVLLQIKSDHEKIYSDPSWSLFKYLYAFPTRSTLFLVGTPIVGLSTIVTGVLLGYFIYCKTNNEKHSAKAFFSYLKTRVLPMEARVPYWAGVVLTFIPAFYGSAKILEFFYGKPADSSQPTDGAPGDVDDDPDSNEMRDEEGEEEACDQFNTAVVHTDVTGDGDAEPDF